MAVTLQAIATQLDVSTATVSRSLRHDPLINPRTRARVNEMALRLGYTERSRRPRSRVEVGTLGFMLRMNSLADAEHDPNIMRMMEGVMAGADALGIMLNVHGIRHADRRRMTEELDAVPSMVRDRVCEALIIQGDLDAGDVAYLSGQIPIVSLNRIYRDMPVDCVVADDVEGVRSLTADLIAKGHTNLVWVHDYYDASYFEARQSGFLQACLGGGLSLTKQVFLGPESYRQSLFNAPDDLLVAVRQGATAVVCANDFVALQVIAALEDHGFKVPEDVSVTGFDAVPTAPGAKTLASVDPHFFDIGFSAVRLAVQRLSRAASNPCIMQVRGEVVPGETVMER